MLRKLNTLFFKFFWVDPKKKLEGFCMEFSKHYWATI